MKVKINKIPQGNKLKNGGSSGAQTGDQMNLGLFVNPYGIADTNRGGPMLPGVEDIRATYPEVDRKDANLEVELGELVVSPDLGTIYKVAGKKHSKGGTPIKAKAGSYVISDFVKTDPTIKEALGFDVNPKDKTKETWAEFMNKQVNSKYYNSLAALIEDKEKGKEVDPYSFNTAKNKLPQYQEIVSKVALGNEMSKALMGKPMNIPQIAMPALMAIQQQPPQKEDIPMVEMQSGGQAPVSMRPISPKYNFPPMVSPNKSDSTDYAVSFGVGQDYLASGAYPHMLGNLQQSMRLNWDKPDQWRAGSIQEAAYQDAESQTNDPRRVFNKMNSVYDDYKKFASAPVKKFALGDEYDDTDPYKRSKTKAGSVTPTGKSSFYHEAPGYLENWSQYIPEIAQMSNTQAQSAIYDFMMKRDPHAVNNMWQTYGLTNEGKKYKDLTGMTSNGRFQGDLNSDQMGSLKKAYVDNMFGARQMKYSRPDIVNTPGPNYGNPPTSLTGTPRDLTPFIPGTPGQPRQPKDPIDFSNPTDPYKQKPNAFDEWALGDAMSNPINTYYPWAAKPEAAYIDPQFDDPNYYPIQSAQRQRMDMLNQVSSPQMARAVGSYQPDQISGIIGETQRAHGNNLQVANQFKGVNAQTFNNYSGMMSNINTDLYNKTVMTQEQRDIARQMKKNDVRGAAQNLVKNMTQMQYLHAMYPQYAMTGPFWNKLQFTGGKSLTASGSGTGQQAMTRDQFIAQNPGYSKLIGTADEFKIDDAMRQERLREEAMMFRSSNNFNQNYTNPFVQMMMNSGSTGYPPGLGL